MPEIQTTTTERALIQALRGLDRLRADAAQRMHGEADQLEARAQALREEAERIVAAHRREWLAALAGISEAHGFDAPAPGAQVLASPDASTLEWADAEPQPEHGRGGSVSIRARGSVTTGEVSARGSAPDGSADGSVQIESVEATVERLLGPAPAVSPVRLVPEPEPTADPQPEE